jgi:DNA-binding winged helix-turn-helix (wHTH) protein
VLPSDQQEFEFGPFKLDGRQRRLTRDGTPISVGGRALDILVVLAKSTNETVAKASLLDQVWPGLTVEENNLQVHISPCARRWVRGGSSRCPVVVIG